MKQLFLSFFLFSNLAALAEKYYDYNTTCQQAYKEIMSLRIENGKQLLLQERQAHPDNLIPYFLDNYTDFFSLFFNEDPKEFETKLPLKEARLSAMKVGPKSSPWHLYTQAMMQAQWAAIHIKFSEKWAAGWSFKSAFSLVKENQKLFPNFAPNSLIMGPLQVAAGTIPTGYQWLSGMLGIKGNIGQGMKTLYGFLNSADANATMLHEEAQFFFCYLKFHIENKPDEALAFITQQKLDVVNNQLFTYMAANLSLNNHQSAAAKNYVVQRNTSLEYMPTPIWDFELAYAKLFHLEAEANLYFNRFLQTFKGKFYVKDSWLKLSWYYFLQGNMAEYNRCLQQVKTKGSTDTDADKKALKEAMAGRLPNMLLLKARLLSDGGYHAEALLLLKGKSTSDFAAEEEKLEFAYRLARINDELGKYDDALSAYLTTIKIGKDRTEYFAARAAVQVGNIYEQKKNNRPLAIAFYQQCLDMKDHDYKNSLDQKAKAGIARCMGE